MARRTRVPARQHTERGKVWFTFAPVRTSIAANSVALLFVLNAAALALRPFTIIRSHFSVLWLSDQVAAIEDPFGAVGGIVVTDSATAAGAASIPDAVTDMNAGWFFHQILMTQLTFLDATGFTSNAGRLYEIDSKAMRKVGTDDDVGIMGVNSNTADGASIVIGGRMLVKLL